MEMDAFIEKSLEGKLPEEITALCLDQELSKESFSELKGLYGFFQLEDLSLSGHSFQEIDSLSNLGLLKRLTLSYNKIQNIEPLAALAKLEFLDLSFNQIQNIEPLENCILLEELHLEFNVLTKLNKLSKNINLKILGLSGNKNITSLDDFEAMPDLKELYLNRVRISNPKNMEGHPGLERLVLSFPEPWLEILPTLPALNSLSIFGELKSDFLAIPKIQSLRHLKLHRIPGMISIQGLEELNNLETLEITRCELKELDLSRLSEKLNRIDIRHSKIETIIGKEKLEKPSINSGL